MQRENPYQKHWGLSISWSFSKKFQNQLAGINEDRYRISSPPICEHMEELSRNINFSGQIIKPQEARYGFTELFIWGYVGKQKFRCTRQTNLAKIFWLLWSAFAFFHNEKDSILQHSVLRFTGRQKFTWSCNKRLAHRSSFMGSKL